MVLAICPQTEVEKYRITKDEEVSVCYSNDGMRSSAIHRLWALSFASLALAVEAGRAEIAELLISKGADVNISDLESGNALYHAAVKGRMD